MQKITRFLLALLSAGAVTLASCEQPAATVDPNPEQPAGGTPTEIGLPDGASTTQTIGPAGGTITLPGNKLVFRFPAGAVSQPTPITIQPVVSKTFNGVGTAFDIQPKNLQLQDKATVTWNFTDAELDGTAAEALRIAYQDEKGVWQGSKDLQVDKAAKTVTAPLNRLAPWSFYTQFFLTGGRKVLAPGEQCELVVKYMEEVDVTVIVVPLNPPKVVAASRVKKWAINGKQAGSETDGNYGQDGQLTEDRTWAKATYDAPPREPEQNPVTISVHIKTEPFGELILSMQQRIESPAFMKIEGRYDGNPMVGLTLRGNTLGGVMNDSKGTEMLITFHIEGFHGKGTYEVNRESSISIVPNIFGDVPYVHGYYNQTKWISGGGKITITEYNGPGKPMAGTISGNFFKVYLSGAVETKAASGKFRSVPVAI